MNKFEIWVVSNKKSRKIFLIRKNVQYVHRNWIFIIVFKHFHVDMFFTESVYNHGYVWILYVLFVEKNYLSNWLFNKEVLSIVVHWWFCSEPVCKFWLLISFMNDVVHHIIIWHDSAYINLLYSPKYYLVWFIVWLSMIHCMIQYDSLYDSVWLIVMTQYYSS